MGVRTYILQIKKEHIETLQNIKYIDNEYFGDIDAKAYWNYEALTEATTSDSLKYKDYGKIIPLGKLYGNPLIEVLGSDLYQSGTPLFIIDKELQKDEDFPLLITGTEFQKAILIELGIYLDVVWGQPKHDYLNKIKAAINELDKYSMIIYTE